MKSPIHHIAAPMLAVTLCAFACVRGDGGHQPPVRAFGTNRQAISTGFAAGSLIIPMDTTYQNSTMLKAYGLVNALTLQGIPVSWAIETGKAIDGADFTASATDVMTGTTITSYAYAGGPFIVDSAVAPAALSYIKNTWNKSSTVTTVHQATASFTADIREQIASAPHIAIDLDGYEYLAFNYLNAAGIPDSQGNAWPTAQVSESSYSTPDVVTPTQIGTGILLNSDGTPAFTNITSMHYNGTPTNATVQGVRNWLAATPLTMAIMECAAITAFENNTTYGHFLTTDGFSSSTTAPGSGTFIEPDQALDQTYIPAGGTTMTTTSGAVAQFSLAGGSTAKTGVEYLAAGSTSTSPPTEILWMVGNMDGNTANGQIAYLAGHDYSGGSPNPTMPITSDLLANGIRLYLDSFMQTAALLAQYQPVLSVNVSSPAVNTGGAITWTINYTNTGVGIASGATITDTLPAGVGSITSTGGGVLSGQTVTWSLGNLKSGATGSVTVTGRVTTDGTYTNQATLGWKVGLTPQSTTSTSVENVFPSTTITSGPTSPTFATTASFSFTSSASGATFQCSLDSAAYSTCTSPASYSGLSSAAHTFAVESTIPGGNTDLTPATWSWTVNSTPPTTQILTKPANPTNQTTAVFTFGSNQSPVTYQCELNGTAVFTACTGTFTGLTSGSQTLVVRAVNSAGDVDPSPPSYTWVISTTPPTVSITSGPSALSDSASATFTFQESGPEPVQTFLCSLDGAAFTDCSTPTTLTGLSNGEHVLLVSAVDTAGNTSTTPAVWQWTVGTERPTATIVSGPNNPTNQSTATFVFSSDESPVTYWCELTPTTTAFTPCPVPPVFTGLADGTYTLNVGAVDQFGNTTATPATWTWTVDTTLPTVRITDGPTAETNARTATFAITASGPVAISTYLCSLDGAAFTTCSANPTLTGITNGSHTLLANVVDAAGNSAAVPASWSWAVSTTRPTVTIVNEPPSPTDETTAVFTFSSSESGSTYLCELDGATTYTPCPSSFTNLGPGQHTISVEAVDPYGNTSTPVSYSWTIDTTPPVVTITSGPLHATNATSATFVFKGTDTVPISGFVCTLDGTSASCTSPTTYTGLALGTHLFLVSATDDAGNTSSPPASWSWTVDVTTTAPTVTIVSSPPSVTDQTSATFVFSSNESPVTFECELNGATTFTPCPVTFTNLPPGKNTVVVEAVNQGGTPSTPVTYSWTIDTALPVVTITSGPAADSNSTSATFVFKATDSLPITGYLCSIDNASMTACTSPQTYSGLANGAHVFQVTATDEAGNVAQPPAVWSWDVETTPPSTTIVSGPAPETSSTTATFTFSSDQSPVTYLCELDGATTFTPCPSSFTGLSNGPHTLKVEAEDSAGNVDPNPPSYTWTVDTTPPVITITAGPATLSDSTDATFALKATDSVAIASYHCSLDDSPFTTCTNAPAYTGLAGGQHFFQATATDVAGNTASPPASWIWTIGTTKPVTTIVSGPPSVWGSTTATFVFASTADPVTYLCKLDGATTFTPCSDPSTFTNLSVGPHTLTVESKDEFGNVDVNPPSWSWTVQISFPVVTIKSGPARLTNATTATFELASTEPVTYACSLDGAAYATCTASPTFTDLKAGSHTLLATGTDSAGNSAVMPASYTWEIGTELPTTNIVSGPPNPSTSTSAVFVFASDESPVTFQCKLDTATTFTECPAIFSGLTDGSHTLTARAMDSFGNVDPNPPSYSWVVDTTPPDTTIVSGPPALTNQTTAQFEFGSNKSPVTYQCELDAATSFTACAQNALFSGLASGPHLLQVRAVDSAGLVDPTPAIGQWMIDTSVPTTTILSGPDQQSNETTATFTFIADESPATFQCAVDGAAWSACTTPLTYNNIANGSHSFTVRATNAAGTVDPHPPSYPWTVGSGGTTGTTGTTGVQQATDATNGYGVYGARLGCSSSGGAPWALLWLVPVFAARRRTGVLVKSDPRP